MTLVWCLSDPLVTFYFKKYTAHDQNCTILLLQNLSLNVQKNEIHSFKQQKNSGDTYVKAPAPKSVTYNLSGCYNSVTFLSSMNLDFFNYKNVVFQKLFFFLLSFAGVAVKKFSRPSVINCRIPYCPGKVFFLNIFSICFFHGTFYITFFVAQKKLNRNIMIHFILLKIR